MGFSPIWSRPDWMICQVLAVPPPAVRPSVKHDSQQRSEDDISHIIVNIIKANKTLQKNSSKCAMQKLLKIGLLFYNIMLQQWLIIEFLVCPVAQKSEDHLNLLKKD